MALSAMRTSRRDRRSGGLSPSWPRTREAKILPPELPGSYIGRPRLLRELVESQFRRLTIVLADAGYGKSVLLGAWSATVTCAWYTVGPDDASLPVFVFGIAQVFERRLPSLSAELRLVVQTSLGPDGDELDRAAPLAAALCEALERELPENFALVLDDVHELGRDGPSVRLLEELCRQAPARLHLVLASRVDPPFPIQRLRGRGDVLDIDAPMLAFDTNEVAAMLEDVLDDDAAVLAAEVYELTAGWPAAVRLVAEALRPVHPSARPEALSALRRPGGRLFSYMAEEVFARAAPGIRQLLCRVAPFERFNIDFCRAIGVRAAAESLVALRRSGLFIEVRGEGDWFALHALVREFVHERWPLEETELRRLHVQAAAWLLANDCFDEALESLLAAGDLPGAAAVLEAHGPALLAAGKVESTIRIARRLPRRLRNSALERLVGEAHEIRGEWDESLECFERAAGTRKRLDAGLAWRLGLIHHLRGRLDEALAAYQRGELTKGEPRDAALLLTWTASAHWLRGDAEACRACAEEAFAWASTSADPGALAAAHTVLAMLAALSGDRLANDAHYLRALEYAGRAGDVLQAVRVRTNRGSRHLEEGEYEEALVELETATRLADLTGFVYFRALALTNRGEVRYRLGRLEEAITDLEASKALYQRAGSRMVCYALVLLADVYRERGDAAMARAFYEEALQNAEGSGDVQGLVPALGGLAQLLAADEPDRAQSLAERAVSFGEGMGQVAARVAAGWVALARDDPTSAAGHAEEAATAARLRRDRAGLAQALELAALASDDRARRAVRLEEAISLWRGIESPLGEARAELLLGITQGGPVGWSRAEHAEVRLRTAGAYGYRTLLGSVLPTTPAAAAKPLAIATLGRFAVVRAGRPVGANEWQSRKARDLLKILVARRTKRTPRERLMEALWPDGDPRLVSNRLSVALSTLRGVLDPEHGYPADHFVVASTDAIGLRAENVDVDVDTFFRTGEWGLGLYRRGCAREARPSLEAAEAAYVGDFLEEDIYEDWATPLREEARAAYLAVAAALAELAEASNDPDAAIRYRLRILERDPYDERAHLGLVSALDAGGRHGEARRTYRAYVARMGEIGVEPAPFPQPDAAPALSPP
jgi:ATP/maltotriose-dependent transcriptional regulator MalT/DNA-binding SARP family transcriptional activator